MRKLLAPFENRCLAYFAMLLPLASLAASNSASAQPNDPGTGPMLIIAHRGACGYLPEHTLEAKALAHGMGADVIEQDVVLSRDGVPIVLHDIHLDTVTDVAEKYPDRRRDDGRFYAIDFDLGEIKQLTVHERTDHETGKPVFPKRFPIGKSSFRIPTLAEELELIAGLNSSTGRIVGIHTEIKKPAWHRQQGQDISAITLHVLRKYDWDRADSGGFLQCFDPVETRRLHDKLEVKMPLVQLIGDNGWGEADTDYPSMCTPAGLKEIATYADGIGPWMPWVIKDGQPTSLLEDAHQAGLVVHPFTFRADALPEYTDDFAVLVRRFRDLGADGIFTDFPDQARAAILVD